jgi:regulator of sigma E protease
MQYCFVILLLGLLIFIHELGHFLAAKAWGLPVDRFSLGLGPVLWSRRLGGTSYCLSAIPFGGYVLLGVADEKAYLALPLGRRVLFSLAGPLANIVFAVGAFGVLYFLAAGEHTLAGALTQPVRWTAGTLLAIATAIPELLHHSENVSSFVGIVAEGGRFVGVSAARFVMLGAHLSLSLAVFNLLPLPPLDGGKIVFDTLSRVCSRLSRAYVPSVVCGWLALVALMLYATVQDVWKYLL